MSEYGIVTEAGAVRFERLLPGPIERVWAYLTQSDKRENLARCGAHGPADRAGAWSCISIMPSCQPKRHRPNATSELPGRAPASEARITALRSAPPVELHAGASGARSPSS